MRNESVQRDVAVRRRRSFFRMVDDSVELRMVNEIRIWHCRTLDQKPWKGMHKVDRHSESR